MKLILMVLSLAIAGCTTAQTKPQLDSIYVIKKKYEQTKKNCIHLDTVTTEAKQVNVEQKDIIARLKIMRKNQIAKNSE